MTTHRIATTRWQGNLTSGNGEITFRTSDLGKFPISWKTRTTDADRKTSPEELIAAAHSSCYSMSFAYAAAESGYCVETINVTSDITFTPGIGITGNKITLYSAIPEISEEAFQKLAEKTKTECPVSKALTGVKITLEAHLE